jgi:hypothetical protein
MVSVVTFDEEAHHKEVAESTSSESLRIPPATKEKNDSEEQTPSPTSDSNVESNKGPILSEWNSDDDPGNPENWPTWKKVFHTAIPALYGFVLQALPFLALLDELLIWK